MVSRQAAPRLEIGVPNEYGRLRLAIVNRGRNLTDYWPAAATIRRLSFSDAIRVAEEERYHPETWDRKEWNADLARKQLNGFIDLLRDKGVKLLFAEDVDDMLFQFFARDVGFVVGNTFYVARRTDEYRRREIDGLSKILPRISKVVHLSGRIEGGSVMPNGSTVYVGLDGRTDQEGFDAFRKIAETQEHGGFEVMPIHLSNKWVLHSDCRFNIPFDKLATVYVPDIKRESLKMLESRFEILPITEDENTRLAANTFTLDENTTVSDQRNTRLNAEFRARGFTVVELPYDEVIRMWGSFRCSILPLYRESE